MDQQRRKFLYLSGIAATGALAGCTSPSSEETTTEGGTTETTTTTTTGSGGAQASGVPGADVLGGPDALQSSATVRAAVLDSDQGAGRYVFTPAVLWVESGTTVSWAIEGAAHSVTAYHPDVDRPLRIPEAASAFDSKTVSAGETFEHTFETPGVYNYFCRPHEGLGMVGVVVVEEPKGGPGTTRPNLSQSKANQHLTRQLETANLLQAGGGNGGASYDFVAATSDTYWYSLYNMSTNIAMNGNGITFPRPDNEQQKQAFRKRVQGIAKNADVDRPPIKNPNLNMVPFTEGDPHFTQAPRLGGDGSRPDATTLAWDRSKSSMTASPGSVAWTHLKGVTWAKNFQNHFDILPQSIAPKFRSQVLTTLAQLGIKATLIDGGPNGNGLLTKGDSLELLPGVNVAEMKPTGKRSRPTDHAAMLWFLSDLTSLAQGGWFGYVNPEPLIPAKKIQQLTDGMAKTTMNLFSPGDVVGSSTRDAGLLLGALGWYGTHSGKDQLRSGAAQFANGLADAIESNVDGNGKVGNGAPNQAATQGIVGQGLLWASQVDGVDRTGLAESVLGYLVDDLWDADAGVFASSAGASTYTWTARDAGDLTGGINAADELLGMDGVRERFARTFDQLFNRGRLQRAERPPSHDPEAKHPLPLPPKAGGTYGQAAVYNDEVEYDVEADEWTVTDSRFRTEHALYLANQDIWMSHWGGDFFQGRGVPGRNDEPATS